MKKRWVAVLIMLCLLCCSCGTNTAVTEEEQKQNTEQEIRREWVADKIEIPDANSALYDIVSAENVVAGDIWGIADETIYRFLTISSSPDSLEYVGYCVQVLKPPYTNWENYSIELTDWVADENCRLYSLSACSITKEGVIYVLLQGNNNKYVGKWSLEEGCSVIPIEGKWIPESGSGKTINKWYTGTGLENYVLYMNFDMKTSEIELSSEYLDENYEKSNEIPNITDGYVWRPIVNFASGKTYLCGCNEEGVVLDRGNIQVGATGFSIWADEELKFATEDTGMSWLDYVDFCTENKGYLWNTRGLWEFSLEEQTVKLLFDRYEKNNLYEMAIGKGMSIQGEGEILVLVQNAEQEHALWNLKENVVQGQEKQRIELAATFAGAFIEQAIVEFNKTNEEYEIVLRTAEDGEDFETFRTRIQAELAAGKGPDLLNIGSVIDLDAGAQKRYLLNLSEYFAEYEDDILPSVWQTCLVDGELYAMPHNCTVHTLVASESAVGGRAEWTLQEAIACMEESDAVSFAGMETEAGLFFRLGLCTEQNADLVDWESGISSLNGKEAEKLLQFVLKYADHESTYDNVYQRVADGEIMTCPVEILGYDMLQVIVAMFHEEEVYIGYPTDSGQGMHLMYGNALGVNRASQNIDGAVQFLEYLVSEEKQTSVAQDVVEGISLFPVRNEALEQVFIYLQNDKEKPEGISSIGEFEYRQIALSDESINKLREVFRSAKPMGTKAEKLMPIVEEELGSFISGEKSAKEVLDIVNNRVQLYIDEIQ